jgi:hypothetical protein
MAKSNKVIYIAGAVVLGIGAYFGYQWWKKRQSGTTNNNQPQLPPVSEPNVDLGSGSGSSSSPSSTISNPFKTTAELLAFQQWVINTKKDKTILGTGGASGFGDDGKWGSKSANAWTKYGSEYLAKPGSSTPSGQLSASIQDAIGVVVRNGQGEKAQKGYLESTAVKYPTFVTNWANAIKKRLNSGGKQGTIFTFANQVYNSYDAKKELTTLAMNKIATVKDGVTDAKVRWYAKWDSPTKSANGNLGKVEGLFYNKNDKALFLYVPNNVQPEHKWIWAQNVNLK